MQVFMPRDTIIPTGQNELSGYQKNFKFSSKTPLECTFEVADPLPIPQTTLELPPALHKEVGVILGVVLPPISRTRNPEKMRSPVANPQRVQKGEPRKARERSRRELAQTQNPHRPDRLGPRAIPCPRCCRKTPTDIPLFARRTRITFILFDIYQKCTLCILNKNGGLPVAHIKHPSNNAPNENALLVEIYVSCLTVCTIMQIFTPGNTINWLVRDIFLYPCT